MLSRSRKKNNTQNKRKLFENNPKSVYTSCDEGFYEKSVFTSWKKLLPLAGLPEKLKGLNEHE